MDHSAIWANFGRLQFAKLPKEVVKVARHCMLDWYGCAVAGSREPLAEILREEFGHRAGNCTVIGTDLKVDAPTAALLNGSSGHALDYDDTGSKVGGHTTAPVLPAVLAIAEETGATGEEILTAFVVGVEVEGRISRAMGRDHYARGWHTTATYGAFGAAAAVAYLLKLDAEQYGRAMGLAASHASGVKANFGTMTKPFHAGHAAESGVNAARLASRGFTANPEAVAGKQGFIPAASTVSEETRGDTDEWMIMGTLFKYHAACHLTHAAIESVQKLKLERSPEELSSLTITVNPGLLNVCGIENPKTGLEGKFSLRGTASLVLNNIDTANPATFTDEVISQDSVQAMINRVQVETDEELGQFQSRVTWVDKSQNAHEQFWDIGVPATDLLQQHVKLNQKFGSLCQFAGVETETCISQLATHSGQDKDILTVG